MSAVHPRYDNKIKLVSLVTYGVPPVLISLTFYLLSPNDIAWVQLGLALMLLQIPWVAYVNWRKTATDKLPVFALVSFMYWIYYALALFWGTRTVSGIDSPFEKVVSEEAVTWSLALAVTGVCSIWLGMKMRLAKHIVPVDPPELKQRLSSLHYLRVVLVVSTLLSLWESFPYIAGEAGRQALTIMISIVPVLAFAILFRNVLVGEAGPVDKALVLGFLLLRLLIGLSSGWLGSFASIMLICTAIYVAEKRKIPRFALVVVILFTLFFQVGKQEFRKAYWANETETSKIDRARFWADASMSKWQDAASDSSGAALADAINLSMSRVSLLTQTSNVVELTPAIVPYQGPQLYSYLLVTLIPRVLWPGKPSVSEANRFYQVTYGLSTQEGLETVAIGVGVMTEAYISFGWLGVIGVMFVMGVFYDAYRNVFFSSQAGLLMTGIGIALLPQMISIESQMAAYVGGLTQQIVFTLLIFSPVIRWRHKRSKLESRDLMVANKAEVHPIVGKLVSN